MTQRSRPWGIQGGGDSGPYDAEDWKELIDFVSGGRIHSDAFILPDSGSSGEFPIYAKQNSSLNRNIIITQGAAICNGVLYTSNGEETLSIPANTTSANRFYIASLKWDNNNSNVLLDISLEANIADTSNVKYFPIARILAEPSFSQIDNSKIEFRGVYLSGYNLSLTVLRNLSSADLKSGVPVRLSTTQSKSMVLSTSRENVFGITVGFTESGNWGVVCTEGVIPAYMRSSVNPGAKLVPSTLSGGGFSASSSPSVYNCVSLESVSSGNYARVYVKRIRNSLSVTTISVDREDSL